MQTLLDTTREPTLLDNLHTLALFAAAMLLVGAWQWWLMKKAGAE